MVSSSSGDPISKSWQQFDATNAEIDKQNQEDAKTRDDVAHSAKTVAQSKQDGMDVVTVVYDPAKVNDAAMKAIHGKDSGSSFLDKA